MAAIRIIMREKERERGLRGLREYEKRRKRETVGSLREQLMALPADWESH